MLSSVHLSDRPTQTENLPSSSVEIISPKTGQGNDDRGRCLPAERFGETCSGTTIGFSLAPIHGFIKGTDKFPIQKYAIFCKFKEISGIARRRTRFRHTSDSVDLSRL